MKPHFLIAAVCLTTLLSACTQIKENPLLGGTPKVDPVKPLTAIKTTLKASKAWEVNTLSAMGDNKIHPYLDNKTIYIAGGNSASAWQRANGKQLWKTVIGENITAGVNGTLLANPLSRDTVKPLAEQVFVGTNSGNAIALDAKTGKIQWIERLSSEVLSVSSSENGRVAFRTADGKLHGLNANNGELIWQRTQKTPPLAQLGAGVPLIISDIVVAGFDNGKIASYILETGLPVWEVVLALPSGNSDLEQIIDVDGRLKTLGNAVFASSLNGSIIGINLQQGKRVWGSSFSSSTGVDANPQGVFSSDDKGNIWAYDPQDGKPIWNIDALATRQPSVPMLVNKSQLIVTDIKGQIHFLNTTDGKFRARLTGDKQGYSVEPSVSGNSVYLLGKSGLLSKINL